MKTRGGDLLDFPTDELRWSLGSTGSGSTSDLGSLELKLICCSNDLSSVSKRTKMLISLRVCVWEVSDPWWSTWLPARRCLQIYRFSGKHLQSHLHLWCAFICPLLL